MANAPENLVAKIAELAAESERIKTSSAEYLWVCKGEVPLKIADLPQPKEPNSLRRASEGGTPEPTTLYRRPDGAIGLLTELENQKGIRS